MEIETKNLETSAIGTIKSYLSWAAVRAVSFWLCTLLVAFEMMAGGVWDLLRIEYVRVILAHLGYPPYLLLILGVWKIPCALVLLLPRFLRLKEWAYAGAFFTYSGAVASHILSGDGAELWIPPLVLAILTLGSWLLRPAERRLAANNSPHNETSAFGWIAPIILAAAFLILAFITLPVGPPPALGGK